MSLLQRTNSSPNVGEAGCWGRYRDQNYHDDSNWHDFGNRSCLGEEEFYVIGDRVYVDGQRAASVAYFGETEFGSGDWVGVVLDEASGNHDGKLHGREYFQCAPHHGLFVRAHRLTRKPGSSRCASPASRSCSTQRSQTSDSYSPAGAARTPGSRSTSSSRQSTGSSLLDSYQYDDDYRQTPAPNIASLARELKFLDAQQASPKATTTMTSLKPRAGILKQQSSSGSPAGGPDNQPEFPLNFGARVEELNRRLRASSSSPSSASRDRDKSVFNFRPRREQLSSRRDLLATVGPLDWRAPATRLRRQPVVRVSADEPPRVGERVLVCTEREGGYWLAGQLRFMGETKFATGEWAGVELDEPMGRHDGSLLGHRYFVCPKNYGLFVPVSRVRKWRESDRLDDWRLRQHQPVAKDDDASIFGSMRSTIKSPPPPPKLMSTSRYSSRSDSAGSATPSCNLETLSPSSRSSSTTRAGFSPTNEQLFSDRHYAKHRFASSQPSLLANNEYISTDLDEYYKPVASDRQSSLSVERAFDGVRSVDRSNWRGEQERAKFDERDIEFQLRKSLNICSPDLRSATQGQDSFTLNSSSAHKPKAVQYTFISSKLDGNPIAIKKLLYK